VAKVGSNASIGFSATSQKFSVTNAGIKGSLEHVAKRFRVCLFPYNFIFAAAAALFRFRGRAGSRANFIALCQVNTFSRQPVNVSAVLQFNSIAAF